MEPAIEIFNSDILIEGDFVFLTCKVDGYPYPGCLWLKDEIVVRVEMNNCSDYKINDIKREDAGTYYCVARNLYVRNAWRARPSNKVKLQVYCK